MHVLFEFVSLITRLTSLNSKQNKIYFVQRFRINLLQLFTNDMCKKDKI